MSRPMTTDIQRYLRHLLLTHVHLDNVTVSQTRSGGWLISGKACSATVGATLDELAVEKIIDIDHDGEVFLTYSSGLELLENLDCQFGIPS